MHGHGPQAPGLLSSKPRPEPSDPRGLHGSVARFLQGTLVAPGLAQGLPTGRGPLPCGRALHGMALGPEREQPR
eukprot:6798869-Lingulodinium_polyedra.AAC.1